MTAPETGENVFTVNPLFVDRSNPSQLAPRLFLAGAATAREHERLRTLGVTAIVNLTPDDFGCEAAGFKVLHLKINDAEAMLDAKRTVARFIEQMDAWEASGETVLIHCHAGISRTASFAIAWLMHQRGCHRDSDLRGEWSRAEDRVGHARPIIMPHYLLKRAVLEYFAARGPR